MTYLTKECHSGDSPYSVNMNISSGEWRKKYKLKRKKKIKYCACSISTIDLNQKILQD